MHLNPATWMERTDCGPVPHETELARSECCTSEQLKKENTQLLLGEKLFSPETIFASPIVVIKQYDYLYPPLSIRNESNDFAATYTVFVVPAASPTRPNNPHVVADFVRNGSIAFLKL